MSSWILPRELSIEELTFVIMIWIPSILSSFILLAANPEDTDSDSTNDEGRSQQQYDETTTVTTKLVIISLSTILYVTGSFLNTYSELKRTCGKHRRLKITKDGVILEGCSRCREILTTLETRCCSVVGRC